MRAPPITITNKNPGCAATRTGAQGIIGTLDNAVLTEFVGCAQA
jgi:hypothetical protein